MFLLQVSKWFENARWSYNHRPGGEPNSSKRTPEPQPTIGTDITFPNQNMVVSAQNPNAEAKDARKRKDMVDHS